MKGGSEMPDQSGISRTEEWMTCSKFSEFSFFHRGGTEESGNPEMPIGTDTKKSEVKLLSLTKGKGQPAKTERNFLNSNYSNQTIWEEQKVTSPHSMPGKARLPCSWGYNEKLQNSARGVLKKDQVGRQDFHLSGNISPLSPPMSLGIKWEPWIFYPHPALMRKAKSLTLGWCQRKPSKISPSPSLNNNEVIPFWYQWKTCKELEILAMPKSNESASLGCQ